MTTDFSCYFVTWNVHEAPTPENLSPLLKLDREKLPNLYAIGLQEVSMSLSAFVVSAEEELWTKRLTEVLSHRNYVRLKCIRLVGMLLVVFVQRPDLIYITNVETQSTSTGVGGLGFKGAVTVRLDVAGVDVCIVNCHLEAHMHNKDTRIDQYISIIENQTFRDTTAKNILDHDYVFWIGDLNFRLDDIPRDEVLKRIENSDTQYLLQFDQLLCAMEEERLLIDFQEAAITFPPSYKFDPHTDVYDSAKKRKPAWCDRILCMVHEDSFENVELSVQQLFYQSLPEYKESDHKPVISEYIVQVLASPPELPVMFEPQESWRNSKDSSLTYIVDRSLETSTWDWIGLYRADYQHFHDYVKYQWATGKKTDMGDGTALYSCEFNDDMLQDFVGLFCLCYYSSIRDCVVGYSDVFKIKPGFPGDDSSSCGETSSDASTDRDAETENFMQRRRV